jgi:hypothetical protein
MVGATDDLLNRRRVLRGAAGAAGLMLALLGASVVSAGGPGKKCNSGGGNDSETEPSNDCDPGNSGGHNNGKD